MGTQVVRREGAGACEYSEFARTGFMSMPPITVPDIHSLIPADLFVGAGAILPLNGRFLFAVRPPKPYGAVSILELTAVGGAREPADKSLSAVVVRESQEEIRCELQLASCRRTLIVYDREHIQWVEVLGAERPAAIVFRNHRTPPRQPWDSKHEGRSCLILFLAQLHGRPVPTDEIPAVIWLDAGQIVELCHREVPLQVLLDEGAECLEERPGALPRTALARVTDSQEALVIGLGPDALHFFEGLEDLAVKLLKGS